MGLIDELPSEPELGWERDDPELARLLAWYCGLNADRGVGPVGQRFGGERLGPNDPCICGSGRKFKKCCGRQV
jgi:uncharacterized protein YecA (UPF0149 family)